MSDDQFTKLFKYIEEFRSEVSKKLDVVAPVTSLNSLVSTSDEFNYHLDIKNV